MARILGWPFLVTCNHWLDYRAVVAPAFMVADGTWRWLAEAAGGSVTQPGRAIYREIKAPDRVSLAVAFRVVDALGLHLDTRESREQLRDPWGRRVYLIEGIVLEGFDPQLVLCSKELDRAHASVEAPFREFWGSREWEISVSEALEEESEESSTEVLELIYREPFRPAISGKKTPPDPQADRHLAAAMNTTLAAGRVSASQESVREDKIHSLQVSRDGKFLLALSERRLLHFDLLALHDTQITWPTSQCYSFISAAFNPSDSYRFIVAVDNSRENIVVLHDTFNGREIYRTKNKIRQVLYSRTGKLILVIEQGRVACLEEEGWILKDWRIAGSIERDLIYLEPSPKGEAYLGINAEGVVETYESWDGAETKIPYRSSTVAAAFLSEQLFAFNSEEDQIMLCYLPDRPATFPAYSHPRKVAALTANPKNNILASVDSSGAIKIYDSLKYKLIQEVRAREIVSAICHNPRSGFFVLALESGQLQILSLSGVFTPLR